MFARLVLMLVNKHMRKENGNKLIFLVQDNVMWLMREILRECQGIHNIQFVSDKQLFLIRKFDYHCNLLSLIKYLNIDYKSIKTTFISYRDKLKPDITERCKKILNNIKPNTYIFNWKGNPDSTHEKHNRMMNLINAISLFKITQPIIHWLVVTKNLTEQEKKILQKYKIKYIGDVIDQTNAYYDTISILKHANIKGVISTDTSLPHLSLSLGVKTYVLLTTGCEWRWTQDDKTNWYPEAILIRQKNQGDWSHPIQKLASILHTCV
jgi:ADP-heptose:LPS heptosyltransferase